MQGDQRVGRRSAEHARVHCALERADFTIDVRQAAQRGGQRRHADGEVARVADEDRVCAQELGVLGTKRLEAARCPAPRNPRQISLTPTGKPRASCRARSAVRCTTMLPLQSAAPRPYQRPSRSVSSNGGRLPAVLVERRLHVVVAVEEHRGRAVGGRGCGRTRQGGRRGFPRGGRPADRPR